jgi:hypothetical protein
MGQDKKLDDILREHLGNLSAPYQEADWEKAQQLLPSQKTSSLGTFTRRGLGALALLGVFGAGYWFGSKQSAPNPLSLPLTSITAEQVAPSVAPSVAQTEVNTESHHQNTPILAQVAPNPSATSDDETKSLQMSIVSSKNPDTLADYARSYHSINTMGGKTAKVLRSHYPSPAQFLNLPIDQLVWLAFNPLHHPQTETPSNDRYLHGNQLGIMAGAGLFQSFKSYAGFNAVLNPSIGLMFMHWKGRFGLSLGAIYTPRSGVNAQYTYTQTTYDLEAKTDTGFVFTRQLHMIDFPVLVHYQIHPKHFVSFGPSLSWLANTTSTTQLVGERTKTRMMGYQSGFRQLDWGFEGGWGMQVNRALGLNVTAHVGMRDLSRNEVYHNGGFDRNLGLRVMLRYKLFANR